MGSLKRSNRRFGHNPLTVQNHHLGSILVGIGNGSVRSLRGDISLALWQSHTLPADGGVVGWE